MKVVVLGDGLLGKEIINQTGWDYYSRKKDNLNINNIITWSHLLLPYDVVVNCIAYTKTYDDNKQQHWDVNYKAVSELVDYCNNHNKKLIHISTDYIYANSFQNADEEITVPAQIETWYGYTKLLGDAYVQLKSKNYLICRESHKPFPFPYKEAWDNVETNGDFVNVIAELIIKLINKDAKGVFNVGTEPKTIYDLAVSKGFNVKSINSPSNVPINTTMNLNKLKKFLND
jgi:dTDP-4-dehydrorhamnose reductase